MPGDVFIDTNILVYAYDRAAGRKQERALETLDHLVIHGRGRLSVQILGEFFRATTTKLKPPLPVADARTELSTLARTWPIVPITPLVVLEAARGVDQHGLSYWDAQIWATARLNQIDVILTEDFSEGRVLEGVTFRNPFLRGFTPTALH
jgi:predicted nucleic acid-binding protein